MAKKKKDDFEENEDMNEGRADDINEADDNFGLPDVEYSEVDKTEDEPAEDQPVAEDTTHSETESRHKGDYLSAAAATESSSTYEPGSYRPRKQESNTPKILILLGVILLVAIGLWYFLSYQPQQQAEQARIEAQEQREQAEARQAEEQRLQEEQRRQEEARLEAERIAAEEEAARQPQTGTFQKVSSRTGGYYVIVASSLDEDLATDYANKLTQQGHSTKLLAPTGNNKFHRVAVADFDSWAGAQEKADELKGEYGENVWVVKY